MDQLLSTKEDASGAAWRDAASQFGLLASFTPAQVMFETQAQCAPSAIAVQATDRNQAPIVVTYGDVNREANRLAHQLREFGAGPDSFVGICMERSPGMIISVLAALKSGAAYVPMDPSYPQERLNLILEDASIPILLTQDSLAGRFQTGKRHIICVDSAGAQGSGVLEGDPVCRTTADHLAYVIYTSGSTGRPKGVAMRHGPLSNLLSWQAANWSYAKPANTLQFASLNFDVSFQEIFSTWRAGGTLVLVDETTRRDPRALLHFIKANAVQRLFLPFIALKHLAEAAVSESLYPAELREIITAGEQLQITPALIEFFSRLDSCTLENQYGPSETHVVTAYRLTGRPREWPVLPPIGTPIANTRVYLLDEAQNPVAPGEAGELYLGGACLARGYLNRPELTEGKFVSDPFDPSGAGRLYRTGDLGREGSDGNIEFLGRIDNQVKIAGVRVELGEIEATLHLHPSVNGAAVTVRDGPGGEKQLVAFVVAKPNTMITSRELRGFLKRSLPAPMLPSVFAKIDSLPLTPSGKVDRRALPEALSLDEEETVKLPRTALEMSLQLVFERFLNRRPIGVDDNFFELGGDSLQALKLIIELERVAGRKLSLGILYQAPSIESLARVLEQEDGAKWSSLVPLQPLGDLPPLFLVHSMPGDVLGYGALVYDLGTEQPCYGLQSLGLNRPEEAHLRLEEMAACYVKLIRNQQPSGPYYLGGWCYGGIIAVEMAFQLLAAGESVAFLGLIETPASKPSVNRLQYYARRFGCLMNMGPVALGVYLREKIKYYRGLKKTSQLRFRRLEPGERPTEEVEAENRYLERLERVYKANSDALDYYRSRPYPGEIVLFNAAEQDPALIHDPQYGWVGLAAEIETHIIPGNHATILMEPQAQVLAREVSAALVEARARKDKRPS